MPRRGAGIFNTKEDVWGRIQTASPEECWLWVGKSISSNGYPVMGYQRVNRKAATLAYESFFKTEVPPGKVLMHSCHNRLCCNPHHLSVGTYSENNQQRWDRVRAKA